MAVADCYPVYIFCEKDLTYFPVCVEVSQECVDKWNKIKLEYKEMQKELQDIYDKNQKIAEGKK